MIKSPMRIFLDMDGVLCDFYAGIWALYHKTPAWPYRCIPNNWDFYGDFAEPKSSSNIAPKMTAGFYYELPWMADGKEILERCEDLADGNVYLLTSPWNTIGCRDGKYAWVNRCIPKYKDRLLIGSCKEACSAPDSILIDDSHKNCAKWAAVPNGGESVLLPRPWNPSYQNSCLETGRVLDLEGFFSGGIACVQSTNATPVNVQGVPDGGISRTRPPGSHLV